MKTRILLVLVGAFALAACGWGRHAGGSRYDVHTTSVEVQTDHDHGHDRHDRDHDRR